MRITNGMVAANTLRNINKAANRLADANAAVSSNQKIQIASDDPVVAARAVTYRSYVSQIKQYQDNAESADAWQTATDDALSDLSDLVTTLKTLTTQASSDTISDADLTSIKASVEEGLESAISLMNTTYNGSYIFGGYSTNEAPYEVVSTDIGDTVTFKGDYLSLGGVVSADIDDADIISYYTANASDAYNSLTSAAATALAASNTAASAAAADPTNVTLAAKAAAAQSTSDTLAAAVTTYGGSTNLTDAVAAALTAYTTAKTAADADPTNTTLADAATAAKTTSDALAAAAANTDQDINYNIGFNSEVTVNIEGQDVTGEGTSNLFNTIAKLLLALDGDTSYKTASLDSSGNVTVTTNSLDLTDLIDEFSTDLSKVTVAQAALGASMDTVTTVTSSLGDAYTAYSTFMSDNEDIDTASAATELTSAEYTYEAALAVGAKVISKSLIDYIA
ncbi:flagellar hook-associated protein FlgL [Pelosinus sp. UFO1]|uniref:flagellar hook-associated protein FlgL n=1 Tax=Pelosinus sp. UFO1 TaxID=484770 RepID=UPI0004D1C25A|nr:flagellar hook-associated protein FlgL [Pelosinus sp. UFO1]AIF53445.1 flagellar hook-associated protein 3 [Pelosinus sp. UFO1]